MLSFVAKLFSSSDVSQLLISHDVLLITPVSGMPSAMPMMPGRRERYRRDFDMRRDEKWPQYL